MSLTVRFNEHNNHSSQMSVPSPYYEFHPFAGTGMSHQYSSPGPGMNQRTLSLGREFQPKISYARHSGLTPLQDRFYNYDAGADMGALGIGLVQFLSQYFNGKVKQDTPVPNPDSPAHGTGQRPEGGGGPQTTAAGRPQQPHEHAHDSGTHTTQHPGEVHRQSRRKNPRNTTNSATSPHLPDASPPGARWSDIDTALQSPPRSRSPRITSPGGGSMTA